MRENKTILTWHNMRDFESIEDNKIEITKIGIKKTNQEEDLDMEQLQQEILALYGIYKTGWWKLSRLLLTARSEDQILWCCLNHLKVMIVRGSNKRNTKLDYMIKDKIPDSSYNS